MTKTPAPLKQRTLQGWELDSQGRSNLKKHAAFLKPKWQSQKGNSSEIWFSIYGRTVRNET